MFLRSRSLGGEHFLSERSNPENENTLHCEGLQKASGRLGCTTSIRCRWPSINIGSERLETRKRPTRWARTPLSCLPVLPIIRGLCKCKKSGMVVLESLVALSCKLFAFMRCDCSRLKLGPSLITTYTVQTPCYFDGPLFRIRQIAEHDRCNRTINNAFISSLKPFWQISRARDPARLHPGEPCCSSSPAPF